MDWQYLHERMHYILPVVFFSPGLHTDERGPRHFPRDAVVNSVEWWNGKPVTVDHPFSQDGKSISARDPDILENLGVGELYRVRYEGGKLRGEVWIDVADLRRLAPSILENIENGRPVQVSAGLDSLSSRTARDGYPVADKLLPDHLAILTDDRAPVFRLKDGYGLFPTVNRQPPTVNLPQPISLLSGGQPMATDLTDILPLPTMNWGLSENGRRKKKPVPGQLEPDPDDSADPSLFYLSEGMTAEERDEANRKRLGLKPRGAVHVPPHQDGTINADRGDVLEIPLMFY